MIAPTQSTQLAAEATSCKSRTRASREFSRTEFAAGGSEPPAPLLHHSINDKSALVAGTQYEYCNRNMPSSRRKPLAGSKCMFCLRSAAATSFEYPASSHEKSSPPGPS